MVDHVVDTNVLLVASAADPSSPFKDTHVPTKERKTVFEWLKRFRGDGERHLVMDWKRQIFGEYRNKLTDQDYGFIVARDKIAAAIFVPVEYGHDGAVVPQALAGFDRSDKKFVAAHLAHVAAGGESSIVNACDTDWHEHEETLTAQGVIVEHILPEWCRSEYLRKHPEKRT